MRYLFIVLLFSLVGCANFGILEGKEVCYTDTVNNVPVTVLVEETSGSRIVECKHPSYFMQWVLLRQYKSKNGWVDSHEFTYSNYKQRSLADLQGYLNYLREPRKEKAQQLGDSPQFCQP